MADLIIAGIILTLVFVIIATYVNRTIRQKLRINEIDKRYVFVSAADDAVGRRLVFRLDQLGFGVFAGCGTRFGVEKLTRMCTERVIPVLYDIRKTNSIEEVFQFVAKLIPADCGLWAIVNNHNLTESPGLFEWTGQSETQELLTVNLLGVMELTRVFLPLIRRNRGRIVNVCTTLGVAEYSTLMSYCITKAGVEAFTKGLRIQLRKTGVTIQDIAFTAPNYFETDEGKLRSRIYRRFDNVIPEVQSYYGEAYVDYLTELTVGRVEPSVVEITEAFQHALTATFPKQRYFVDKDWMTRYVPECILLYFSTRTPMPEGLLTNDIN